MVGSHLPPHFIAKVASLHLESLCLVLKVFCLVNKDFNAFPTFKHLQVQKDGTMNARTLKLLCNLTVLLCKIKLC